MRYGLITDIHSNLEALEAVVRATGDVEAYLCLGDIVGYGPEPSACLARVRELPGLEMVVGNHDLAAADRYDLNWFNPYARIAVEWTSERLTAEEKAYLLSLPYTVETAGAVLVHGSLPEPMAYIATPEEALDCFDAFGGACCFIGHTHVAEYYRLREGTRRCEQIARPNGGTITLAREARYIINPGSVGQPRDGSPTACCGVYDTEAKTVELRRVEYEVGAVQRKMEAVGLPQFLIERLSRGV